MGVVGSLLQAMEAGLEPQMAEDRYGVCSSAKRALSPMMLTSHYPSAYSLLFIHIEYSSLIIERCRHGEKGTDREHRKIEGQRFVRLGLPQPYLPLQHEDLVLLRKGLGVEGVMLP